MVKFATSLRATEATGVHDHSSRTHAVCRVFIHRLDDHSEGMLQLVDLAGTEHRLDCFSYVCYLCFIFVTKCMQLYVFFFGMRAVCCVIMFHICNEAHA